MRAFFPKKKYAVIPWYEQGRLAGHFTVGPVTVFGFNAMHVALQWRTKRWGYVCFHPPMRCFKRYWPWYLYVSQNATPWAASWGCGSGYFNRYPERRRSRYRRP